jgi:hypothetical protein
LLVIFFHFSENQKNSAWFVNASSELEKYGYYNADLTAQQSNGEMQPAVKKQEKQRISV